MSTNDDLALPVDPDEFHGRATVQYNDYLGTAAADDSDRHTWLEELAGLDPDEWHVVGVEIGGGRVGDGELFASASVLAIRGDLASGFEELQRIAADRGGSIPVHEFRLAGGSPMAMEVFITVFKRWSVHFISKGIHRDGINLQVVERHDPPETPDEPSGLGG